MSFLALIGLNIDSNMLGSLASIHPLFDLWANQSMSFTVLIYMVSPCRILCKHLYRCKTTTQCCALWNISLHWHTYVYVDIWSIYCIDCILFILIHYIFSLIRHMFIIFLHFSHICMMYKHTMYQPARCRNAETCYGLLWALKVMWDSMWLWDLDV